MPHLHESISRPMKSWNRKGSHSAKTRMAELRDRKVELMKRGLIAEWQRITGRHNWWIESGLQAGCGRDASIAWLRAAIANEQSAPTAADIDLENFFEQVELLSGHKLDNAEDFDSAYIAHRNGVTASDYALEVVARAAEMAGV